MSSLRLNSKYFLGHIHSLALHFFFKKVIPASTLHPIEPILHIPCSHCLFTGGTWAPLPTRMHYEGMLWDTFPKVRITIPRGNLFFLWVEELIPIYIKHWNGLLNFFTDSGQWRGLWGQAEDKISYAACWADLGNRRKNSDSCSGLTVLQWKTCPERKRVQFYLLAMDW